MKTGIEILYHITIYENPIPNLVSRFATFPGLTKLPSGDLLALFPIGEAFDAMNNTMFVSRSRDVGRTWILQGPMHTETRFRNIGPCSLKPLLLDDGTLIATGYGFYRDNPETFANPATGGLPGGPNLISFSTDEGRTWSPPELIPLSRPELLETSGPCIQLQTGELFMTGATMPMWDGRRPSGRIGVALRSPDRGRTWDDASVFYRSPDGNISPYETRSCQMPDGRIVTLIWMLDEVAGRNLTNHVVVSADGGRTWSPALDTGVPGQASNLIPLRDNLLLAIHSYREGDVGLYVSVVDFTGNRWEVLETACIWGKAPAMRIGSLKDMSANLRFGQPSLLPLGNGEFLAAHWAIENGQGKILGHRIRLRAPKGPSST